MDKNEIKSKASKLRKENQGTLILADILAIAVLLIPFAGVFLYAPAKLGAYENYLNVLNGEPSNWENIFKRFEKQFRPAAVYGLFFMAAMLVAVLIARLVSALFAMILPALGTIAFVLIMAVCLPVIIGTEGIGFQLFLNDPQLSGNLAFHNAFGYIKKYTKEYFSVMTAYLGEILLTVVTLGIYGIVSVPEISMAYVILNDSILSKELAFDKDLTQENPDAASVVG